LQAFVVRLIEYITIPLPVILLVAIMNLNDSSTKHQLGLLDPESSSVAANSNSILKIH